MAKILNTIKKYFVKFLNAKFFSTALFSYEIPPNNAAANITQNAPIKGFVGQEKVKRKKERKKEKKKKPHPLP